MTLTATLIAALLTGFTGGYLFRGRRKRAYLPNGSALQKQPEPVWAQWKPEFGKGLRR